MNERKSLEGGLFPTFNRIRNKNYAHCMYIVIPSSVQPQPSPQTCLIAVAIEKESTKCLLITVTAWRFHSEIEVCGRAEGGRSAVSYLTQAPNNLEPLRSQGRRVRAGLHGDPSAISVHPGAAGIHPNFSLQPLLSARTGAMNARGGISGDTASLLAPARANIVVTDHRGLY